jgi:hypothetical protein
MSEKLLARVYEFIRQYSEYIGVSPTLREIAEGCHMSLGSVLDALALLEIRGWIEREDRGYRSISIPSYADD